jgi:hypothetical protein
MLKKEAAGWEGPAAENPVVDCCRVDVKRGGKTFPCGTQTSTDCVHELWWGGPVVSELGSFVLVCVSIDGVSARGGAG